MSDDEFEYEEAPWDSEEEEEAAASAAPPQPELATGVLRDGRRFAAVFCSPTIGPLEYPAEAKEMLDTGVLSSDANLSQGATLDAVEKLLRDFDPHVLWFVGHGDVTLSGDLTLGWTTAGGGLVLIDPRVCSAKLSAHTPRRGGSLECVVLNACQTMKDDSALGPLLHAAGVPFVAGWRSIVADAAAPFFTRGFLVALQRGADYARAFEQGTLGVTTPTEGPDPSLRALRTPTNNLVGTATTQRFELVDPKSPSVVQPSEVNAPHWTPPRHGPLRAKWRIPAPLTCQSLAANQALRP